MKYLLMIVKAVTALAWLGVTATTAYLLVGVYQTYGGETQKLWGWTVGSLLILITISAIAYPIMKAHRD